jgi:hypothetical protein
MAFFQSLGIVALLIVTSNNRARYGIMASPPSFNSSPEILDILSAQCTTAQIMLDTLSQYFVFGCGIFISKTAILKNEIIF